MSIRLALVLGSVLVLAASVAAQEALDLDRVLEIETGR